MVKAYKYRIYPTDIQKELIHKQIGCCRFVYNSCLEYRKWMYSQYNINLNRMDLGKELTRTKREAPELNFLNEVSADILSETLINLESAFRGFFKGGGYPRYKNKNGNQSFNFRGRAAKIDWDNKLISIPKIKQIPIILHRDFRTPTFIANQKDGLSKLVRSAVIVEPDGSYFVSIGVEDGKEYPNTKKPDSEDHVISIDIGTGKVVTFPDGRMIENLKPLQEREKRLAVLQRQLAKKKKGSENYKKQKLKVAKLHASIRRKRAYYTHEISREIANLDVREIRIETLNLSKMMQQSINKYPRDVSRKLNRSLADTGLYELVRQIKYKCRERGVSVIMIDPYEPTNQTCHACGCRNNFVTFSMEVWTCRACGNTHNKRVNTAKLLSSLK